jgi:ATP-dependent Clp protease, protease subunit
MKNLIKLFVENRSGGMGLRFENKDQEANIYVYDTIGSDYWGGVSASEFVKAINSLSVDVINIHINSPGGDVFDGRAMATAIKQTKAKTVAHIDALCASAATYVALSCDEVRMSQGAFFMIHNAWTLGFGNADDLEQTVALLRKIDDSIADDYVNKTSIDIKKIKKMMDETTWMTADECLEKGFIDFVDEGKDDKPKNNWNLSAYGNAPTMYAKSNDDESIVNFKKRLHQRLELLLA